MMMYDKAVTILYPRAPIEVDGVDYIEGVLSAPIQPLLLLFEMLRGIFFTRYVSVDGTTSEAFSVNIVSLLVVLLSFLILVFIARFLVRHEISANARRKWFFASLGTVLIVNFGSLFLFGAGSGIELMLYIPILLLFFLSLVLLGMSLIEALRKRTGKAKYALRIALGLLIVSLVALVTVPGYFEFYGEEVPIKTPVITVPTR